MFGKCKLCDEILTPENYAKNITLGKGICNDCYFKVPQHISRFQRERYYSIKIAKRTKNAKDK